MKKLTLSALLAATLVSASDYNYEISPMVGYALPNNGQELKNHGVYGVEAQYNGLDSAIKPELSVLYSDADYEQNAGDVNIFRTAINGVYDLSSSNGITPFIKAGLGYETMSNHALDNHNSAFADVGAGVKVALAKQIALKLEAIDMVKFNDFNWDNNLLFMAGLNFAFGEKAQPAAPAVVAPAVVAAVVAAPKPTPVIPVVAPAAVCPVDSDKDGIFDPQDKCPNTPEGFKVDADGCPLTATLKINFETNSDKIKLNGDREVHQFADFLKDSPAYKANIVGYTDSVGTDAYNQKLSLKRANATKEILLKDGVAADRLTAEGKGEANPIASNATEEGRALNRRVEAELIK